MLVSQSAWLPMLSNNSFTLNVPAPLNNGDGLTFFDREGHLQGMLVNRVDGEVVFPAKMDRLYTWARKFAAMPIVYF